MVKYYRLDSDNVPVEVLSQIQYFRWLRIQPKEKQTNSYYIINEVKIGPKTVRAYFTGYSSNGSKLFKTALLDDFGIVSMSQQGGFADNQMAFAHLLDTVRAGEASYRR